MRWFVCGKWELSMMMSEGNEITQKIREGGLDL